MNKHGIYMMCLNYQFIGNVSRRILLSSVMHMKWWSVK